MELEFKQKKGKKNIVNNDIVDLIEDKKEQEPEPDPIPEPEPEKPFLFDLDNQHYNVPNNSDNDNDSIPDLVPIKKTKGRKPKAQPKVKLITEEPEETGLFSDKPTELLGRERLELISKINQYKSLFPDQLKKFKVKNKATKEELEAYLSEAEAIVETSNVESFLTDSILECFRLIEGVSARTRYNVSGMTDLLKANKQFHSLCKQLYAKYGCFKKVPAEYQLIMIISTTAYIAQQRNTHKQGINDFLDEPLTG